MKKEGFEYSGEGEAAFTREYGVYKTIENFHVINGEREGHIGQSTTKALPGVSPLVFTKFLLESAVFISLGDIATGLPGYREIPLAVDMDAELSNAYHALETQARSLFGGGHRRNGRKLLSQLTNALTVYPDQPYDRRPIVDPDDGHVVLNLTSLDSTRANAKDQALLRLVRDKIDQGEKVLIYYPWTNSTDVTQRLSEMFNNNAISSVILTSSVKARDREKWINDHMPDNDVMICNPSLIDTGLDLLDFTTIVFYQTGYNLFTMRQASRRSWRLTQTRDVEVYFMYYRQTVQENMVSLMATKLQAAMAIEGKFSEEGLNAMSNNEDLLTQVASNVVDGIKDTVDVQVFDKTAVKSTKGDIEVKEYRIDKPRETVDYDVFKNIKKTKKAASMVMNGDEANILDNLDAFLNF